MKKLLLAAVLLMGGLCGMTVNADNLSLDLGKFGTFTLPFDHLDIVSLWEFRSKTGLMGAETPVYTKNFAKCDVILAGGALTSLTGSGAPFVRSYINFPNPVGQFAQIESLNAGVFGGYDFNQNLTKNGWIVGVALSRPIW